MGTGPEIYEQTNKSVTHFVMGASTGGTVSVDGLSKLENGEHDSG